MIHRSRPVQVSNKKAPLAGRRCSIRWRLRSSRAVTRAVTSVLSHGRATLQSLPCPVNCGNGQIEIICIPSLIARPGSSSEQEMTVSP